MRFDYANLLGNMQSYDEAVEQYKQYLTAFPDDANAYRNLGLVYKKMNNNDLALFNFEKSYSITFFLNSKNSLLSKITPTNNNL